MSQFHLCSVSPLYTSHDPIETILGVAACLRYTSTAPEQQRALRSAHSLPAVSHHRIATLRRIHLRIVQNGYRRNDEETAAAAEQPVDIWQSGMFLPKIGAGVRTRPVEKVVETDVSCAFTTASPPRHSLHRTIHNVHDSGAEVQWVLLQPASPDDHDHQRRESTTSTLPHLSLT